MNDVAVLGVGLHPWGKSGGSFVQCGIRAARAALRDANVPAEGVRFLSAAATVRQGYAGLTAGMTYARALNLPDAQVHTSYGACVSGAQALAVARSKILSGECDVAIAMGADVAADGILKPAGGEHACDPDWIRYSLGFTNPVYLALQARRRMHLHATTERDLSMVKVKNSVHGSLNENARYRYRFSIEQIQSSPMQCDPLRLLHICSTSDGGAAVVLASKAYARRHARRHVSIVAVSTPASPAQPAELDMGSLCVSPRSQDDLAHFLSRMVERIYEASSVGAEDLSLAEVYDLSCASELEWYEHLQLCGRGEAERLVWDGTTRLGGRIPVNTSGGLSSMGEAPSAQVLAQVCELAWQLRGQAGARQVRGANVGIAVSQGIFGHAGAIVLKR